MFSYMRICHLISNQIREICNLKVFFLGVEIAQPYLDDSYVNGGVILEDDDEDLGLRAHALYDYQAGK